MPSFGEIAWKPRLTLSSAISNAGVVTVSELVGASHYSKSVSEVQPLSRRLGQICGIEHHTLRISAQYTTDAWSSKWQGRGDSLLDDCDELGWKWGVFGRLKTGDVEFK